MSTPTDEELVTLDGWPGGVNNRVRETEQVVLREGESIPSSQFLRRALNVDLTAEGHPLRRRGYSLAVPGFAHSTWWCKELSRLFAVVDGTLRTGLDVQSLLSIATVNRYLRVDYTYHEDSVFWVNGKESGSVQPSGINAVWPDPARVPQPGAQADEGELITDEIYEIMPVGQLIESFAGRLWVAQDDYVYFSQPLGSHYYRPATNFFQRPEQVTLLLHGTDGMYVGTESGIWWLAGTNPFEMSARHVSNYGNVPLAFARVPGDKLNQEELEDVPIWWGRDGVLVAGLPQGRVVPLTRDRLAIPEFQLGAVSIREREGISQFVSSLQKGGDENSMAATDSIVAEVRRNGITV